MSKASRDRDLVRNARQRGKESAAQRRASGSARVHRRARARKVEKIRSVLSRAGVMDRVRGVRRVLASQAFDDRFNAALATHEGPPITKETEVRALMFRLLEDLGADHGDVDLGVKWDPDAKKLDLWPRVKHATAQKAAADAGLFAMPEAATP